MDKIKRKGYFLFFATGFLIGGLVGILTLNFLISYRIDKYHQKIGTLELLIEEKNVRLEKLEDTINKKKLLVKNVEVTLENIEDEITKVALQKHIKERLGKFIGREVSNIDTEMMWEINNQRIMKIEDKNYRLKVTKLMISETIRIWIEVSN